MVKRLLLSCFLLTFAMAQEQEYVFKAKGEFAQELKMLMEKHAKEGKIEVEVVDAKSIRSDKTTMLDRLLKSNLSEGDITYGKSLYERTCSQCHGEQANKSSYPNARVLKTISKEELVSQLRNYRTDPTYGGSTRMIMNQQAIDLTEDEIISLAAYIHSFNK